MKKEFGFALGLVIVLLLSYLVYYSITREKDDLSTEEKSVLAKCLTEKEIYLYGTINCPNCEVQKEKFDESQDEIVYINCFREEERCFEYSTQKVFPFWGIDGVVVVGPIPLIQLKEIAGC